MDALAADLFERHGRSVRAYLRALTGNIELGDDLAQDVFLRVVRSAPRYEARERERAWLFRIAKNALADHRRRVLARPVTTSIAVEPLTQATFALRFDLRQALARLAEPEREAFLMAEIGGLSYAEIASTLDLTVPAVRSAIYRARLSLRAHLVPPPPLPATKGS
jgi:RNA polymerase sigma-70 factor (ECF subfamily)